MRIIILCVGKIKEKFLKMGIEEYLKRLSKYIRLDIIEVNDEKTSENLSAVEENIIKNKEAQRMLAHIKNDYYIVSLAIDGKQMSSEQFSSFIQSNMTNSIKTLVFIIGGSIGLSDEILNISDYKLSFSDMTFPHQMMRMILLEQIYRAYRIINNEPYHK